jgi:signal transduction histidine kinase
MLAAAHGALADGDPTVAARAAFAHQDAFLDGMDRIVAVYEREAEERVVRLRQAELVLLLIALVVLALEGAFVFRPAARALRDHLAQRDRAEAQLLQVSDREQKRLARDLHDGLGQHLVGVSYLLKALRQEGGMAAQRDRFDEINRLLTDAIEQTRSMARALHSHTLEMEGLVAALQGLALQTERVYGIACRVELAGEIERPRAGLELYGIAREAIANAARHAHATAIDIVLTVRDDQVTLVVCDDGIGIGTSPDGLGLHLMRHRARLIGAALEVSGGPSRGTVVTCVLNEAGA